MVAMIDSKTGSAPPVEAMARKAAAQRRTLYTHPQPEEMGPEPPKNPYRR
jgi:hypothetical protein